LPWDRGSGFWRCRLSNETHSIVGVGVASGAEEVAPMTRADEPTLVVSTRGCAGVGECSSREVAAIVGEARGAEEEEEEEEVEDDGDWALA